MSTRSASLAGTVRYATDVTAVGPLVPDFVGQGMLILFGENAPEELREMCVLHRPFVTVGGVQAGDRLRIDDLELEILAVGERVNANLIDLGHISLKNDGRHTATLPGDVCLEAHALPIPAAGSRLEIVACGADKTRRT